MALHWGDWFSLASLVVAVVGFGVTLWRIRRVRAEVAQVTAHLSLVQALIAGDDLRELDRDLRRAVADDDDGLSRDLVRRAGRLCDRLTGVLQQRDDDRGDELVIRLSRASGMVFGTQEALDEVSDRTLHQRTQRLRKALAHAIAELDRLAGLLGVPETRQD